MISTTISGKGGRLDRIGEPLLSNHKPRAEITEKIRFP